MLLETNGKTDPCSPHNKERKEAMKNINSLYYFHRILCHNQLETLLSFPIVLSLPIIYVMPIT